MLTTPLTTTERVIALATAAALGVGLIGLNQTSPSAAQRTGTALTANQRTTPRLNEPAPTPPAAHLVSRPAALPPPAPPEPPRAGCPVPPSHRPPYHPPPVPPPAVAENRLPRPIPVARKAASLAAVTGKGLWVTTFSAKAFDMSKVLAQARQAGVRNLWVRTGGSIQGYYGDGFLPALVPAAHAAGLSVVAWDFPFLSDPVADAVRARRALANGIDAFAPDVETGAEGTRLTDRRLSLYLSLVRAAAGGRPVVATVPRATPYNLTHYPYATFRPYADVFAPMVYWSCNEPGLLVHQSMQALGRILPVAPIGQGYDMAGDGGRSGLPTRAETWRFLDTAKRSGAVGASMWTAEAMSGAQYSALAAYPW